MRCLAKINHVWLVILIPFVVLMTAVRILLTPLTIDIEYILPNVPADPYGFTWDQRETYAKSTLKFLTNSREIAYLADQTFEDGQSLYNERELSHMQDVKILVQKMSLIWYFVLGYILITGVVKWRRKNLKTFWRAIRDGGWVTLGLIVLILAGVAINFDWLFTGFHRIFFTGDTWIFYISDTLIRLFPMEFWLNLFVVLGIFTFLFSVILILLGNRLCKEKSG
jgi:integral membrane protein (TIGR01906 family)